ncbi:unnamed protein product [Anisakis simplex]|uniref:Exonuclease 1 n=1 Tax=Anisakis simplex TaxID=6269 RepID=A0A0M3J251_ANISI|nr:unnamed protein product [Anisakis simplex]
MDMVDILVAPYESDAQLAFLTQTGIAHAVVTEDSDLIAFGCEKIILKMQADGSCTIYERSELPKCFSRPLCDDFDFTKFRRICILAGCDYLKNGLPGVGLNKAATFMSKTSGTNLEQILPRLPRYLNMKNLKIKKEFIADAIRAENTFLHQIVYDPRQRRQRPLNEYPKSDGTPEDEDFVCITIDDENQTDYSYAGKIDSPTTAFRLVSTYSDSDAQLNFKIRMALGNLAEQPRICDKFTLPKEIPEWSIWSPNFRNGAERLKARKEAEEAKKQMCGAFVLTGVRKVQRSSTAIIYEKNARDDDTTVSGEEDEDDFIQPIQTKSNHAVNKNIKVNSLVSISNTLICN